MPRTLGCYQYGIEDSIASGSLTLNSQKFKALNLPIAIKF